MKPKHPIKKVKRKAYAEENIQKALQEVAKGMSKKLAAKTFGVPRATIQFRIKHPDHKSKPGPSTVLTDEEEQAFVDWVTVSSRKGFPKRKKDLIRSASDFLKKSKRSSCFKNGEKWFKLFLSRHPTLVFRTPESVTAASSTVSEDDVRGWFRQITDYFGEHNLLDVMGEPGRIFNGDETNFLLCPKSGLVLSSKGDKNVYEVDHAQAKTSLTVMFTFCANGNLTPPMIIFPYKRLPGEITNQIPEDWGVGLSDNGWMNSDIFYQYIKNVLYPHLVKVATKFPIILFVDGHKSHLTFAISELCTSLQIILISLYPNCTRLLQPADVAAFKPLKTEWQKSVLDWRRTNPTQALTKTQFVPLLKHTIEKSFKPQTIINGFRVTGLCPWNVDAIDYSKCLGGKNKNHNSSQQNNTTINKEKVLTKDKFIQFLGENKIKDIELGELTSEESVTCLKKIWQFFNDECEVRQNLSDSDQQNQEIQDDNLNHLDIQNMSIVFNDSPNMYIDTMESNQEHVSTEILVFDETAEANARMSYETYDVGDLSLEPHYESIIHTVQINHNPPTLQFTSEPVASNTNTIKTKAASCLPNLTPVKLSDILVLPKTPQRKGIKNNVKVPFVLTSAGWKAQEYEKVRIKQEKAEGIKKRKEERERKKLEKEAQKASKSQKVPKLSKRKPNEVVKYLFSEDFYNLNNDANIAEDIDNENERLIRQEANEEKSKQNVSRRRYTTAELEEILTELDD